MPPEAADPAQLPSLLKGFGAVPPLISDIDLSLDDRFLYVACWGTGELRQYDVTDPMQPALAGSVRLGGIVQRTRHPDGKPFGGEYVQSTTLNVGRDHRLPALDQRQFGLGARLGRPHHHAASPMIWA